MKRSEVVVAAVAAVVLIGGTLLGWLPLQLTEVLGFVTGAIAVWLVVRENIWNWPIGIANSLFYIAVFFGARLYADMSLQVVYVVLGLLGWYWWLHGGAERTALSVGRASWPLLLTLAGLVAVATYGMMLFLRSVNDSAPFLDALTTTLSLAAQFLLTRKLIENWYVWITADIIYIGLYLNRALYLTAGLYAIFLCMCIVGLWQWRQSLVTTPHRQLTAAQEVA